jgi:hypothetical protein
VHVRVDAPGILPDALDERGRDGGVAVEVVARELDVDRRGQAEVEDLGDDVGRLEEKLDAGEALRQLRAQEAHELLGRTVPFLQRKLDLAVERTDRPALLYERLMPLFGTPRLSRIVSSWSFGHELTDRRLDVVGEARRLLDPRPVGARRCSRIWPASTLGKKSRPEEWIEAAREHEEREEADAERAALCEHARKDDGVRAAHSARTGDRRRGRRAAMRSARRCARPPRRARRASEA